MNNLSQLRICAEKMLPENKNALKELKMKCNGNKCQYSKLKAAFYTSKLWSISDVIKIKFLENPPYNLVRTLTSRILNSKDENGNILKIDPLQKEVDNMNVIDAIIKIITEHVQPFIGIPLQFVKRNEQADIKISFDPNGGAWSFVGTDCRQTPQNEPTMNFGWFDVATTIHEFGHALGMIHEHQNPKGNTIDWDEQKVYRWASQTQGWDQGTTFHNIIEKYDTTQINGSVFDPQSIMLYFFPGSLTLNNKGTHQNLRLSSYDVEYLNSMYPNNNKEICGIVKCETPDQFYTSAYNENINSNEKNTPKTVNIPSSTIIPTKIIDNTQISKGSVETNKTENIFNDNYLNVILIFLSICFMFLILKDYIIPHFRNGNKN